MSLGNFEFDDIGVQEAPHGIGAGDVVVIDLAEPGRRAALPDLRRHLRVGLRLTEQGRDPVQER
jgi:hypothetical protein